MRRGDLDDREHRRDRSRLRADRRAAAVAGRADRARRGVTDLGEKVIGLVAPHVRRIELAGSRAAGTAGEWSDWDFVVETDDLDAVPELLAPLKPIVQQWDRLSSEWCWMVILRDPVKVDLIFPNEPHEPEPPWEPSADNLGAIEDHFWDWMIWLKGKEAAGKREQVDAELDKLFQHLLGPLGADRVPASVAEAIASYEAARSQAEQRLGVAVPRDVEAVVAPALRA